MRAALPSVDLRPDHWAIVRSALRRHVPDREVLAFGSRATWTAKAYSDLDLAVMGEEPLSLRTASALDEALGNSDLPFKVDVVDWARIDDAFRRIIRRNGVPVQGSKGSSWIPAPMRRSFRQPRNSSAAGKWASINLGRVCTKIGSGATPRGGKSVYLPSGPYALIRSQNVLNDGFRHEGLAYIGERHAFDLAGVDVRDGDVLLNITGDSVARACQVDTRILPARVNQHVAIVRPDSTKLDPGFLRYCLVCPDTQAQLLSWAGSGGTRNALTKAMIEAFDVRAPEDVSEQRAIAHILGTLDDKIELNRRMNETLEAMARALFKSWFVDFDPVRAKIEGRETGLPEDIADLFPDRVVDSELGEIPKGWVVRTLGDVCYKPQYGFTASAQSQPVGPRFLRITDINKKPWVSWSKVPYCRATDDEFSKYRLSKGDVLIARMADPGHGILIEEDLGAIFASYLIRFRPIESRTGRFLQYWLNSDAYWHLVRGRAAGTTRRSLNARVLSLFPMVVPSNAVADAFTGVVGALRGRLVANAEEMETLSALRDTLLPKLISGEIRVPEAIRALESVT